MRIYTGLRDLGTPPRPGWLEEEVAAADAIEGGIDTGAGHRLAGLRPPAVMDSGDGVAVEGRGSFAVLELLAGAAAVVVALGLANERVELEESSVASGHAHRPWVEPGSILAASSSRAVRWRGLRLSFCIERKIDRRGTKCQALVRVKTVLPSMDLA